MRKHKPDLIILVLSVILVAVGLVVIYAIGPMRANFMNSAYGTEYAENYFFVHQLISVAVALVAFVAAYKLPVEWVRRSGKWVLLLGFVACAVLAIAGWAGLGIANCSLGACRWFDFGVVGFQPAELVKLGMVLYLAGLLGKRKGEGTLNKNDVFIPVGVVMALALIFVAVLQKDLGTSVVIVAICFSILIASGMKWRKIGVFAGVLLLIGTALIVTSPHRMERLVTFGGEGDSHHIDNALLAIGAGGMFGVGVGNSVQATGYLPESINDSVFAVMGETFGFVGLMLVVLCFAGLLMRMLAVAERLGEAGDKMIVVGVFAWVASHVIINIAAMTGLIPLTGITLPLLSYGGTSMAFVAVGLGIVMQLSARTHREKIDENSSGRGRERGARHTGRRGN